ncbi:MAG: DUF3783 domain-containing protein [Clostridia bacterium]|nr:DUF3783 domain-containing protein [Clostridia bacterium]
MTPTLCAWNFTPARLEGLRRVCAAVGARLRIVGPGEAGVPLARLAETQPAPAAALAAMPFPGEMLLMAAFPDAKVDGLLAGLKREGLAPVSRKAVLTPFNAGWDSRRLYAELSAEAARMP